MAMKLASPLARTFHEQPGAWVAGAQHEAMLAVITAELGPVAAAAAAALSTRAGARTKPWFVSAAQAAVPDAEPSVQLVLAAALHAQVAGGAGGAVPAAGGVARAVGVRPHGLGAGRVRPLGRLGGAAGRREEPAGGRAGRARRLRAWQQRAGARAAEDVGAGEQTSGRTGRVARNAFVRGGRLARRHEPQDFDRAQKASARCAGAKRRARPDCRS